MRESTFACAAILFAVPAVAQTTAFAARPLQPMSGSMVFDARRNLLVVLERGTDRMWDWDGRVFRQRLGPVHDFDVGADYDPLLQEIRSGIMRGIGTWNGANWLATELPTGIPSGSSTFDPVRRRQIWVGSYTTTVSEWDGLQWTYVTPPSSPGNVSSLCFDPSRGRCIAAVGDPVALWSWDGASWTLVDGNGPFAVGVSSLLLAYDPGNNRLILHGATNPPRTWSFDSSGWTQIATPASFSNIGGDLAFDGIGMLRLGTYANLPEGLWRLEANQWRKLPIEQPPLRDWSCVASAPTRPEILLFGGAVSYQTRLDDTWTFDGAWHAQLPAHSPPGRKNAGLAWSQTDQEFVLFGGLDAQNQLLNDTWTWDGVDWTQHATATTPPARQSPCVVSDAAGDVQLFGGYPATTPYFTDQWRWRGHAWLNLGPTGLFLAGVQPVAAYDPSRLRTVVLVGHATWEWNGAAWSQRASLPTTLSNPRPNGIAYRPATQTLLVCDPASNRFAEWDGAQWTIGSFGLPFSGPGYTSHLATDFAHQQLLSLQHNWSSVRGWNGCMAVLTAHPAGAERFGSGCALGAVPGLITDGAPRPGTASFAIEATTLAANSPCVLGLGFTSQVLHLGAGCTSLVAPAMLQYLTADAGGRAHLALPIPNLQDLRGLELLAQAVVVDPPRSLFGGLTFTDGLRISIGD